MHGALCIAYSGQCLTSEAIGGRSANRGACAQACRLPYELVVDGVLKDLGDRAYLLSPEDLEASALVPQLVELGVASIKIEGRLKGPEYVAAATRLYRHAVDAAVANGATAAPTEDERLAALQMYSRGSGPGFLAGIDHQRLVDGRTCDHRGLLTGESLGARDVRGKRHIAVAVKGTLARGDGILVEGAFAGEGEIGGRIWTVTVDDTDVERANDGDLALVWLGPDKRVGDVPANRRVWKTNDPARDREVRASLADGVRRLTLDLVLTGAIGEAPMLEARASNGVEAMVRLDAPLEAARSAPLDEATLRDKLGGLGDTPFTLGALEIGIPANTILPLSSLNRGRRALVHALLAASPSPHATTSVTAAEMLAASAPPGRAPPPRGCSFYADRWSRPTPPSTPAPTA